MEAILTDRNKPPQETAFDLRPSVGVHLPDAASHERAFEMKIRWRYCKDDRAAYRIEVDGLMAGRWSVVWTDRTNRSIFTSKENVYV
jgi:hypothetical protein